MEQEISNKTIVILVVLTVLVTFLSTWTVLHEVNNVKTEKTVNIVDNVVDDNNMTTPSLRN